MGRQKDDILMKNPVPMLTPHSPDISLKTGRENANGCWPSQATQSEWFNVNIKKEKLLFMKGRR